MSARILAFSTALLVLLGSSAPAQQRTRQQVLQDLTVTQIQLKEIIGDAEGLPDPAKLAGAGPKATPLLKRQLALLDELAALDESIKPSLPKAKRERHAYLLLLDDAETLAQFKKLADANDPDAKSLLLLARWHKSPGGLAEQTAVLDEFAALARAHPNNDEIATTLNTMASRAASKDVRERLEAIIVNDLKGKEAQEIAAVLKAEQTRRALLGKPLAVKGTTLDGKELSTDQWKGKVVLVDFWATWCAPCVQRDLPRLKKLHVQHHAKGFEIVGVSSDDNPITLQSFLEKHPDAPWPQIAGTPKGDELHPLTKTYGIRGLPAMIIIDRKGVVRSTEPGEDLEQLVSKLLDEPAN